VTVFRVVARIERWRGSAKFGSRSRHGRLRLNRRSGATSPHTSPSAPGTAPERSPRRALESLGA
jgi:hypothetical protein